MALHASTAGLQLTGGTMSGTISSSASPVIQASSGVTVLGGAGGCTLTGGAKTSDVATAMGWQSGAVVVAANGQFAFSTTSDATTGTYGPAWKSGSGSPEGAVTGAIGSLFSRTNGGAATSLYVKESGSGNTGWVAK